MIYIIDGYNLLFSGEEKKLSLETRRKELITNLSHLMSGRSFSVIIVFDNLKEPKDHQTRSCIEGIDVIYTPQGLTADQYITEELMPLMKGEHVTVVTDDKQLSVRSRHQHAKTQTLHAFLLFLDKRQKKRIKQHILSKSERADSEWHIKRLHKIFEDKLRT